MTAPAPEKITEYLEQIERGDASAVDRLLPHIYSDLRRLAGAFFRKQPSAVTLQPTALVHEAYMKLVRPRKDAFTGRKHFMSVAAIAMRQILANQARDRRRIKRGGDQARVTLGKAEADGARYGLAYDDLELEIDLIALDDALNRLQVLDPQLARVVELRFFAGLTIDETAEILDVDERTVRRRWTLARAWLRRELDGPSS